MAVEPGQIVRGTVVHLAPYGALVRLEDGATGLVHISEIAANFVQNVADHVQQGDTVIVKVLPSRKKGKIELSIKQAQGAEPPPPAPVVEGQSQGSRDEGQGTQTHSAPPPPYARRESRGAFEDKMREFLDNSSDRLDDVRRNTDNKRGGRKSR